MPRVKTKTGKVFFAQYATYRNGGVSCTVNGKKFFYPGARIISYGTGFRKSRRRFSGYRRY